MNEKFFDLKKEKQDRIINAALKIFAQNGYRHASTDDIVREAAISKGLLFHYFGSKLGVYAFVYDYSVRYLTLELSTTVSKSETDLFALLRQVETARLHVMYGYPYMQQFLNRAQSEDVGEALLATEESRNRMEETYEQIYSRADLGKYTSEADAVKLRRMLELTLRGLMTERIQEGAFQPEMLYDESLEYLALAEKMLPHRDVTAE